MISLATDCSQCTHKRICMYKYNARSAMNKLKNMTYSTEHNEDCNWDTKMSREHVDITFSCPSFNKQQEFGIR